MSDLDTLLDATLDDLEDLPTFTPFAAGAHRVLATMEGKEINNKPCVELKLTMVDVMELADPNGAQPKVGDEANTLYFLDNEIGRGKYKAVASSFGKALNLSNLREIVEQVTDVECVIVNSITIDKNDPDKKYLNIKELQVV